MKKFVVIFIFIILSGVLTYKCFYLNNDIYKVNLPNNYENFEKDMFNVMIKLNSEEKNLLINYSLRFKKNPSQISVREALDNERTFEKTNEGTLFFSQLKDVEEKNNLIEKISNSAFVTFVDFSDENNSINIVFSVKNKSSNTINYISGDAYFTIGTDKFTTVLDFNNTINEAQTAQIIKTFNFSEFPALKDISKNSYFKMNIKEIHFSNETPLIIK